MKSRFLKFKIGQFSWIALVSFFAYYGIYSEETFKGPIIAALVIGSFLMPRYFYLKIIKWENWDRRDLERSVDLLRDLIVCIVIYGIVFLPEWWFTKEIYSSFDKPVFFKLKNHAYTDYHTAKELHKRYGIILVLLIGTLDNWMVNFRSQEHLAKRSSN